MTATAADHLLADILDAGLAWDDVEDLLTPDADEREALASTHVAERARELGLDLDDDALDDAVADLVEVLAILAGLGIDSMLSLQGALAVLAGEATQRAA